MLNELIVGRRIALDHGHTTVIDQPHHDAQEWRAFLRALRHHSPFERRRVA